MKGEGVGLSEKGDSPLGNLILGAFSSILYYQTTNYFLETLPKYLTSVKKNWKTDVVPKIIC